MKKEDCMAARLPPIRKRKDPLTERLKLKELARIEERKQSREAAAAIQRRIAKEAIKNKLMLIPFRKYKQNYPKPKIETSAHAKIVLANPSLLRQYAIATGLSVPEIRQRLKSQFGL